MAALYVRLILGHGWQQQALLPADILVVTFTDAATKELRERIRARLTQAAAYFREKLDVNDAFLLRLRADYPAEQWPACAYRLELAANWMDEAAIYTIHGWSNRMLQQHAFDSGSLFKQEVDTDDQELLNQVVRDYWRQFFYPLSATACLAVYQLASSPEQLTKIIKPLLFETEAQGLAFTENNLAQAFGDWEHWQTQRMALENQARQRWTDNLTSLHDLLTEASEKGWLNGNQYRKASFSLKLQELAAWASGDSLELDALAKFGQQKLQAGLTKTHQDKAAQFATAAFQAIDALVEHGSTEINIADIITRHAIQWMRQGYDNEKQRIARMTFDDMLNRLDQALQGKNADQLAATIVKQYPIALIDEFQDTDPVQYRIFARLYPANEEHNPACFMIGDPKQAIYSFRGGDIFTYLKAHQATQGRHYTLNTNFRSTQALVQAVNQVFKQAETQQAAGAFCFKNAHDNPLPFHAVDAKGRNEIWLDTLQPAAALTIWQMSSDSPIGMPDYRRQMADATASEIVRLLQSADQKHTGFQNPSGDIRPLQPADIAILVRSSNEAKAMRAALASRNLRSVYLSERESIFASPEAADLLIWLNALAAPRDERKVRAALSTSTLGWSHAQLRQLTWDEPAWEQQLERFISYQQRWQRDGILPTLRQLMSDYALPARLKLALDGERRLTNLLHLAELLQKASSHLEGEPALIRYLAETIASDQNAEESVIRLESDANLIKIVTIHKSKGLEYPLVFLPFICSFREVGGRNNPYYRYHDTDFNLSIDLSKSDQIKAISDKERLQEDLRLLYVALTRAQFACWLGIAPIKIGNSKQSQLEKSAIGYILGWQAGTASSELTNQLNQLTRPLNTVRLYALQGAEPVEGHAAGFDKLSPNGIPKTNRTGLIKADCAAIVITNFPEISESLYQPAQLALSLDAARVSTARISDNWWIASYSALSTDESTRSSIPEPATEAENFSEDKHGDETDLKPLPATPVATGIHALPRGADPGVLVHELFEQCAQHGFQIIATQPDTVQTLIAKLFKHPRWDTHRDTLQDYLQHWLGMPLLQNSPISLARLSTGQYQAEMEFLLGADKVDVQLIDELVCQHTFGGHARPRLQPKQINGLLKGFIDLVFMHEGQYFVVDYKFNALGNHDDSYQPDHLRRAMLDKRYDLQAVLYLLALHRLLKSRLGDNYDYDQHIGGFVYLFLRGAKTATAGRVSNKPPLILIESLDALFNGQSLQSIAA
ncbi:MAG: exodeoxyribonuclease V subunit beta [Methylomonas sp.]|nr:MAG: exodeoxyribonuclease V subunit beta [Methylomonas sp.]